MSLSFNPRRISSEKQSYRSVFLTNVLVNDSRSSFLLSGVNPVYFWDLPVTDVPSEYEWVPRISILSSDKSPIAAGIGPCAPVSSKLREAMRPSSRIWTPGWAVQISTSASKFHLTFQFGPSRPSQIFLRAIASRIYPAVRSRVTGTDASATALSLTMKLFVSTLEQVSLTFLFLSKYVTNFVTSYVPPLMVTSVSDSQTAVIYPSSLSTNLCSTARLVNVVCS